MARDASDNEDTASEVAECDAKLAQYCAVLDADVARVLPEADPADKAEVLRQLGLKLTYHQADGSSKRPSSLCGMGFRQCPRTKAYQLRMLALSL